MVISSLLGFIYFDYLRLGLQFVSKVKLQMLCLVVYLFVEGQSLYPLDFLFYLQTLRPCHAAYRFQTTLEATKQKEKFKKFAVCLHGLQTRIKDFTEIFCQI